MGTETKMAKPAGIIRKWFILNAEGKSLGRVAAKAALMLRGKHKTCFTPHVDCGDNIIVINCEKAVLTGNKLQTKVAYRHTGWMGGIRETKYSELMKTKPQRAMFMAVKGMLPHNSLGARMIKRLRTCFGSAHGHDAQKPEVCEF